MRGVDFRTGVVLEDLVRRILYTHSAIRVDLITIRPHILSRLQNMYFFASDLAVFRLHSIPRNCRILQVQKINLESLQDFKILNHAVILFPYIYYVFVTRPPPLIFLTMHAHYLLRVKKKCCLLCKKNDLWVIR